MSISQTRALRQIERVPLNLADEIFRHYPAMKLGQLQAVRFYSGLLTKLALAVRPRVTEKNDAWTIVAPPCHNLPAGANLMSREIQRQLHAAGLSCNLVEPKVGHKQQAFNNSADFERYHHYSKNGLESRIEERRSTQQRLHRQLLNADLENKSVIIINDINVTGTQQRFMQQSLDRCRVKACYWLYVFNVDNQLANQHPELEHQINHSRITTLEAFLDVLIDPETHHTARCIARLFNLEPPDFATLMARLTTGQCSRIHDLARIDGRYRGQLFADKLHQLKCRARTARTVNL